MIFRLRSIPDFFIAVVRSIRTLFSREEMLTTDWVKRARLDQCLECPQLLPGGQCRKCTCFVSLKVLLASEACPEGRWGRQTRFSSGL